MLRTYSRSNVIIVHKTKDDFGGLSNMASGYPLRIHGIRILTAEALYQACRFPLLPDVQREIIGQHSPMTAKMKSKSYREYSRSDWEDVRFMIMRWCLRVKLAQNHVSFGGLLLSTGDQPIVELSRKDDYWGAKVVDGSGELLVGQNVLGRLLMELRELLKQDLNGRLKKVPALEIPDFSFLGKPIGAIDALHEFEEAEIQPGLF